MLWLIRLLHAPDQNAFLNDIVSARLDDGPWTEPADRIPADHPLWSQAVLACQQARPPASLALQTLPAENTSLLNHLSLDGIHSDSALVTPSVATRRFILALYENAIWSAAPEGQFEATSELTSAVWNHPEASLLAFHYVLAPANDLDSRVFHATRAALEAARQTAEDITKDRRIVLPPLSTLLAHYPASERRAGPGLTASGRRTGRSRR